MSPASVDINRPYRQAGGSVRLGVSVSSPRMPVRRCQFWIISYKLCRTHIRRSSRLPNLTA